jgi:hypothetical protein
LDGDVSVLIPKDQETLAKHRDQYKTIAKEIDSKIRMNEDKPKYASEPANLK